MTENVPGATYRQQGKRSLPTLDNLRVASPCDVSWDKMLGNGRVRQCAKCEKSVFNISNMTRADAEVLLHDRTEGACVRFYRRVDGTILTADCPTGARHRISRSAVVGAVLSAAVGFLSLMGLRAWASTKVETTVDPTCTMGFAGH